MAVASDYPLLFVVTVGHRSIRQRIGSYYTVALLRPLSRLGTDTGRHYFNGCAMCSGDSQRRSSLV